MDAVTGYEGADSYKHVDPLLNDRGTRLMLISPYVSPYYARMLLRVARRKRIRLITSDSKININALKVMHAGSRPAYAKAMLYLLVLAVALYYFGLAAFAIAASAAFAALLILLLDASRNKSPIDVKVMGKVFVHEKAYISDSRAVVGSANLTYAGMHKNIEHIEVIEDPAEISRLASHFEQLWAS